MTITEREEARRPFGPVRHETPLRPRRQSPRPSFCGTGGCVRAPTPRRCATCYRRVHQGFSKRNRARRPCGLLPNWQTETAAEPCPPCVSRSKAPVSPTPISVCAVMMTTRFHQVAKLAHVAGPASRRQRVLRLGGQPARPAPVGRAKLIEKVSRASRGISSSRSRSGGT